MSSHGRFFKSRANQEIAFLKKILRKHPNDERAKTNIQLLEEDLANNNTANADAVENILPLPPVRKRIPADQFESLFVGDAKTTKWHATKAPIPFRSTNMNPWINERESYRQSRTFMAARGAHQLKGFRYIQYIRLRQQAYMIIADAVAAKQ